MVKHGARVQITEKRLEQVERYMDAHGGKTILVGRFIGLVRALAPFIAGSSKMSYKRFAPYDVIGSGLWAITFCMLGYIFSNNLHAVIHWAERGALFFGWTVGTIVAIVYLVRRFRQPEERAKASAWLDEQEKKPGRALAIRPLRKIWNKVFVPVLRFFGPQLKFAWERFTPGGLGLEFTTVMAILLTAGYTLYFFTVAAFDWPTDFTTRMNDAAFRICDSIRTEWLNSFAEAFTNLGALYVAGPITLIAVLYCLYRRRIPEALVLFFSLALAVILSSAIKNWTEVPRPSDSLVATQGWSYPSGHSAYAVTYITIAITLERVRDIVTRAALVVVAIALTTGIGLSRVYLRAHYLSDVIGGVSLTAVITCLLAALMLLILHVRQLRQGEPEAETPATIDIVS
jgi:undecaprenyl-diphosphatase